ncbi:MAG: CcoQ/FixQ family Cbb3-type cytochrome c oxidase assembly chaperone [Burkholderiales bacterium]|nr:CcoQ/FixQ family Cbb3-type cytochrome c oxidase assembly chaperone [Burkholderiales bacterium]
MGINELRAAVTLVSLAVFIGIVVWAWRGHFDSAAALPLEGDDA